VLDVEKIPAQFARDLKIPGNRQHRLDAGHFLQEDRPSEVAEILAAFMKDI
jgi:pimeloyl-ACP methyl ester carboxylesterase